MNAIHAFQPIYAIAGFAVGMLVGMTGVGGGSLMTPVLILLFGIHPAAAVGTDLLHAAVTKTAGSVVHGFNRTIDWRVVRRLATGSVPMTVVTIVGPELARHQRRGGTGTDQRRADVALVRHRG